MRFIAQSDGIKMVRSIFMFLAVLLILHGCGKKGRLDPPEWYKNTDKAE